MQKRLLELEEAGAEAPSSQPAAKSDPALTKKAQREAVKKGTKRSSDGPKAQPRKRQKREPSPSSEEDESALTSVEGTPEESVESDFSESPKPKKASKGAPKRAPKRGKEKVESSDEEDEVVAKTPVKKTSPKSQKKTTPRKKAVVADDEAEDNKLDPDSEESEAEAQDKQEAETQAAADSESELSVVLDESPKRKPRTTKPNSKTKSTAPQKAAPKAKGPGDLTPDEAEVKLLQSQLQKCGIRKIWGIELKRFGSDAKAKIRHLRQMLRDAGMEGRFSEAKAAEIKEMRELQADLEAVKEGDMKWGMGRGSRSTKNKKSMAVDLATDGEEEEEKDDDEDEDSGHKRRSRSASVKGRERVPRAKMDLAFLGDESDSD
jgi:hypothetical protein